MIGKWSGFMCLFQEEWERFIHVDGLQSPENYSPCSALRSRDLFMLQFAEHVCYHFAWLHENSQLYHVISHTVDEISICYPWPLEVRTTLTFSWPTK